MITELVSDYRGLSFLLYMGVCVAKWLRHWTWDEGVWGSIPVALVMCKRLWSHTTSGYSAVMGTRWNDNLYCVNGYSCRNFMLYSSQGNETEWVPIPEHNWCKVHWIYLNIWTINICLYHYIQLHTISISLHSFSLVPDTFIVQIFWTFYFNNIAVMILL